MPKSLHCFGVHVPPPAVPHLLGPPTPQLWPTAHAPQSTDPPQPSAIGPHWMLFAAQSAVVRGVHPLLPPHTLGVPPPPQN
jgi:hypothetical protein